MKETLLSSFPFGHYSITVTEKRIRTRQTQHFFFSFKKLFFLSKLLSEWFLVLAPASWNLGRKFSKSSSTLTITSFFWKVQYMCLLFPHLQNSEVQNYFYKHINRANLQPQAGQKFLNTHQEVAGELWRSTSRLRNTVKGEKKWWSRYAQKDSYSKN